MAGIMLSSTSATSAATRNEIRMNISSEFHLKQPGILRGGIDQSGLETIGITRTVRSEEEEIVDWEYVWVPDGGFRLVVVVGNGSERCVFEERFDFVAFLDSGAQRTVSSVYDRSTHTFHAIKGCYNVLRQPRVAIQVLRELQLLRLLDHPDIVKAFDAYKEEGPCSTLTGLPAYLNVFIRMEELMNLRDFLLKIGDNKNIFKRFMRQLLSALEYLHSRGVLHRDVKPDNLLVDGRFNLKLCDFGMARVVGVAEDPCVSPPLLWDDDRPLPPVSTVSTVPPIPLTSRIGTLWYLAPETVWGNSMGGACWYDGHADVWSAGCVMFEMLSGGVPLFSGRDREEQLWLIVSALGLPSKESMREIPPDSKAIMEEAAERYGARRRVSEFLRNRFPNTAVGCLDLLTGMLAVDPQERLTASECLNHPWLASASLDAKRQSERYDPGSLLRDGSFRFDLADFDKDLLYPGAYTRELARELAQEMDRWSFARDNRKVNGGRKK